MMTEALHNLDQYMSDLRQILAQGKKRLGILLGAGAAVSINIGPDENNHVPLIPDIKGLTEHVLKNLGKEDTKVIDSIIKSLNISSNSTKLTNIEEILSKSRSISKALSGTTGKIDRLGHKDFDRTSRNICASIGEVVKVSLPNAMDTPYNLLASWIGGTDRDHAVELFTTNYDLLLEEALERASIPFFSGFSGIVEPFFDAATISNSDLLPSRWARLWKIHGSLGWRITEDKRLIGGQGREANELIYPDQYKYDHIHKFPYVALFDRLRQFLLTPDTLLLSCGFSYSDTHITSTICEALSANPTASAFAFQFKDIEKEQEARALATGRPNLSVYAANGAVIGGVTGGWFVNNNESNDDWLKIRSTFWSPRSTEGEKIFTLGDFNAFARFFALSRSDHTMQSKRETSLEIENE